jgi:hypothetical protein
VSRVGEQISYADLTSAAERLWTVLATVPTDPDHAAYLRGAADTMAMLAVFADGAGKCPETIRSWPARACSPDGAQSHRRHRWTLRLTALGTDALGAGHGEPRHRPLVDPVAGRHGVRSARLSTWFASMSSATMSPRMRHIWPRDVAVQPTISTSPKVKAWGVRPSVACTARQESNRSLKECVT